MQVTLSDDLGLAEKARAAGFSDVAEYITELVRLDELDPHITAEAVKLGFDQLDAGLCGPVDIDAVFEEAKARHAAGS